jgi:hypothetical protein
MPLYGALSVVVCYSTSCKLISLTVLTVNDVPYGEAQAGSQAAAKDEAAINTIQMLEQGL